jgi:uncharacterized protein (TIGR00251 family)
MKEEETRFAVQVQPSASRNEVLGFKEGVLHIRIAAPPVKGKANQELTKYLGGVLGIARSRITILKGATSRKKLVGIEGLGKDRIIQIFTDIQDGNRTR